MTRKLNSTTRKLVDVVGANDGGLCRNRLRRIFRSLDRPSRVGRSKTGSASETYGWISDEEKRASPVTATDADRLKKALCESINFRVPLRSRRNSSRRRRRVDSDPTSRDRRSVCERRTTTSSCPTSAVPRHRTTSVLVRSSVHLCRTTSETSSDRS